MRPRSSLSTALALLVLVPAPPAAAQTWRPGWRISAGGGVGLDLHRGDDGDTESAAGVARISVDRSVGADARLGVEWLGVWSEGSYSGESRHHVGLVASLRRWAGPVTGRLGVGLGTATVVEVDGPPDDGVGDVVIGVGSTGGVGGLVGLEVAMGSTRRLRLVPALDVLVQRVAGYGVVTGLLTVRLVLGPPDP